MKIKRDNLSFANAPHSHFNIGEERLSQIEEAILKTVAYADVFDYPLKTNEIHRYLIEYPAEKNEVRDALEGGRLIPNYLERKGNYYLLRGREKVVASRFRRAEFARELWPKAERYGQMIARMPFVRTVAVTGSLVMDNVENRADIDYLLIAEPGRVWVCRAGIIALVRWASLRKIIQFGYPGETREDIRKTFQLVRECTPDDIGMSVSYPLPGTKFFEMVSAQLTTKQNWNDSDDMAMLYKGPLSTKFYRKLHSVLHGEFQVRQNWRKLKDPTLAGGKTRRIKALAALLYSMAILPTNRLLLEFYALKPHHGIHPMEISLSPTVAARPSSQDEGRKDG
jgi:hypothetical protein